MQTLLSNYGVDGFFNVQKEEDLINLVNRSDQIHHALLRFYNGDDSLRITNCRIKDKEVLSEMKDMGVTSESAFGFLYSVDSTRRKRNYRLKAFLGDVLSLRFKWDDYKGDLDPTEFWMHSWVISEDEKNIKVGDSNQYDIKIKLAKRASTNGSSMSFENMLFTVMMSMGIKAFHDNELVRNLAYYVRTQDSKGIEIFTGQFGPNVHPLDPLAGKRVLTMVNGIIQLADARFSLPDETQLHETIIEVVRYIFSDPDYRTSRLKGFTTIHKISPFSLSTKGRVFSVHGNPHKRTFSHIVEEDYLDGKRRLKNDSAWYHSRSVDLAKEQVEMKKAGLNKLASLWSYILSADVTDINCKIYCYLTAMGGIAGYTRGDDGVALNKHVQSVNEIQTEKKSEDVDFGEINYPHGPYLHNEAKKAIVMYYKEIPSVESFRRIVHNMLTNKSAGVAEPITFSMPVDKSLLAGIKGGEDGILTFTLRDKNSVFLNDPSKFTDLRQNFFPGDTKIGELQVFLHSLGLRMVVGGKITRAVYITPPHIYAGEIFFARPFERYDTMKPKGEYPSLGSAMDFQTTYAQGSLLPDHFASFVGTSNDGYIMSNEDYSAFDQWSVFNNTKRYILDGIEAGLKSVGLDGKMHPFQFTLSQLARQVYDYKRQGWLVPTPIKSGKEGYLAKVSSGHYSGLLMTKIMNDLVNRSVFTYFKDVMSTIRVPVNSSKALAFNPAIRILNSEDSSAEAYGVNVVDKYTRSLSELLTLVMISIVGDDFLGLYELVEGAEVDSALIDTYSNARSQVAARCGFSLNVSKTVMREWFTEYLKVTIAYGQYLPLRFIQLVDAERRFTQIHPVDELRGRRDVAAALDFRGMDSRFVNGMTYWTWILRRSVKDRSFRGKLGQSGFIVLPAALYFAPIVMGGIGGMPWMMFGPNKGLLWAIYSSTIYKRFAILQECASSVVAGVDIFKLRSIARDAVEGKITDPKGIFSAGVAYIGEFTSKERINKSREALSRLSNLGIEVPSGMQYETQNVEKTINIIASTPSMGKISEVRRLETVLQSKSLMLAGMRLNKSKFTTLFPVITSMEWGVSEELTQPVHNYGPCPVLDDNQKLALNYVGVSPNFARTKFTLRELLSILSQGDPEFPRSVTEQSLLNLIGQPAIYNNEEALQLVFISIGAKPDRAAAAVAYVRSKQSLLTISKNQTSYSVGDGYFSMFSTDEAQLNRVMSIPSPGSNILRDTLRDLGLMFFVSEVLRTGVVRRIICRHTSQSTVAAIKIYSKNRITHDSLLKFTTSLWSRPDDYDPKRGF
jgi:hypothetical protein